MKTNATADLTSEQRTQLIAELQAEEAAARFDPNAPPEPNAETLHAPITLEVHVTTKAAVALGAGAVQPATFTGYLFAVLRASHAVQSVTIFKGTEKETTDEAVQEVFDALDLPLAQPSSTDTSAASSTRGA